MTSQLIFNIEDLFGSMYFSVESDTYRYHSILTSSFNNDPIEGYKHNVEDFLCYVFGKILNYVEITNIDPIKRKFSFTKKEKMKITDWDIEFLYSVILKSVLQGRPITSRQLSCIKKIKFFNVEDNFNVELSESNVNVPIKATTVKRKEIRFLSSGYIGITHEYDEELMKFIRNMFDSALSYNQELAMNIVNIKIINLNMLDILKLKGFDIDEIIYDFIKLRGQSFHIVNDDGNFFSMIDDLGHTANLIKTLVRSGNIQ